MYSIELKLRIRFVGQSAVFKSTMASSILGVERGYHSHHHDKAAQPFWELNEQAEARRLPFGYSGMIWLVLFPPLFKKVMNPLLSRD
jgi:alkane 1-monooxygenase